MIQIPHSSADLDQMAINYFKLIEKKFNIRENLLNWPEDELKSLMEVIETNLYTILTGRPKELEDIIDMLKPLVITAKKEYEENYNKINQQKPPDKQKPLNRTGINKWFKEKVFEIFNYDANAYSFTKMDKGAMAYDHAKTLNMNTCPYCNTNFTYTIKTKKLKSRPQFDHFYNKGKHPYLALSFFNLIPSCSLCNSGALKGQKQFNIKQNLHPFLESIDQIYQFRTNIDTVEFLVSQKKFDLELVLCDNKKESDPDVKKAKNNLDVFALNDRYNFHKDIAGDVIKNAHIYCNTAIEDLYKSYKIGDKSIFESPQEVKELVFGNYFNSLSFHQRIHSKLVRDIAEEFGVTIE